MYTMRLKKMMHISLDVRILKKSLFLGKILFLLKKKNLMKEKYFLIHLMHQ